MPILAAVIFTIMPFSILIFPRKPMITWCLWSTYTAAWIGYYAYVTNFASGITNDASGYAIFAVIVGLSLSIFALVLYYFRHWISEKIPNTFIRIVVVFIAPWILGFIIFMVLT
jgi:hypothetical protein